MGMLFPKTFKTITCENIDFGDIENSVRNKRKKILIYDDLSPKVWIYQHSQQRRLCKCSIGSTTIPEDF
ncbi:hypothetical protein [Clostridium sp.]|uniref:hypothetical protein n=1 Tax=Clostridium sp. TaxID=1506 RepID=UPI001A52013B|nr:hypothetical protein [Clostridium sp.]MBK5234717.1 hypothetical protein [Clostridium sp.]